MSSAENDTHTGRLEQEREIMRQVERMVGYPPVGMLDLLRVLAHPDVKPLTVAYLRAFEIIGLPSGVSRDATQPTSES